MTLLYVALATAGALLIAGLGLYPFCRRLMRREPYRSLARLGTRQKLVLVKRLLTDDRIPWAVKIIPAVLVLYLAMPFDLIPDFIPVIGYLDDVAAVLVAVALVIRFSPRLVMDDIVRRVLAETATRDTLSGRPSA